MGVYDREYYRDDEPRGFVLGGDLSMNTTLILINVVIFLVDVFTDGAIGNYLALRSNLFTHPWNFWQLVTCGFVHDHRGVQHILFNMFSLWLFGREVEGIYGRRVYLQLYLSLIVLSALVWVTIESIVNPSGRVDLVGASGAVVGIMLVFVLHYPTRTLLIWGVFPMPVWVLAAIQLLQDIHGAITRSGQIAFTAHLAGAAFGYLFYRTGWQLGSLIPGRWSLSALKRRPKLKIHDESGPEPSDAEDNLSETVDRILAKLHREGEASLTKAERNTLEKESRRIREKRR